VRAVLLLPGGHSLPEDSGRRRPPSPLCGSGPTRAALLCGISRPVETPFGCAHADGVLRMPVPPGPVRSALRRSCP
jgi:hypothetical protein